MASILLWFLGGLVFACALLSLASGIVVIRSQCPRTVVRFHIVSRAATVVGSGLALLALVPRSKTIFAGFGTELPGIGVLFIQISDIVLSNFLIVTAIVAVALVLETLWIVPRMRADNTRSRAKVWSTIWTGTGLSVLTFCGFGVLLPLIKLWNDLS